MTVALFNRPASGHLIGFRCAHSFKGTFHLNALDKLMHCRINVFTVLDATLCQGEPQGVVAGCQVRIDIFNKIISKL